MKPLTIVQITAITLLLPLSGCVCLPTESITAPIKAEELSQHVDFLTQPRLKGRSAGSWESGKVRKYLTQRLQAYGCIPWGGTDSFEQNFGFGKNIIAVLPGSDPVLSKEIVLISAHYDHLRAKLFSYYPGACDNAASVAVLLEIAENLSQSKERPKRSICFAFFDAEEMFCLGSFAFSCRDDYDDSHIIATINMDLLGRDLLDVVDNSLIVTGTEEYAQIQKQIRTTCDQNDLKLLPLETNLVGPVGDHIAFVSGNRPALFFTCGIYKDYHQTTDTAEKLNFEKLKRESAVIEDALLTVANADSATLTRAPVPVDRHEADDFAYILDKFKENQDTFKLDPNDIKILDEVITETKQLDPNAFTRTDVINLKREALQKLVKLLKNYNGSLYQYGDGFLQMSEYYAVCPETLIGTAKEIVGYYLKNKPPLFKKNKYSRRILLPVNETNWGLVKIDNNTYLFGFIDIEFACEVRASLLGGTSFSFRQDQQLTASKGSLDDIVGFAFWGKQGDPNTFQIEMMKMTSLPNLPETNISYDLQTRKKELASTILKKIEQEFPEEMDTAIIQKLYHADSFPQDPNSSSCNCNSIFLTHEEEHEKKKMNKREDFTQRIIIAVKDSSRHPADRAEWIDYLMYKKSHSCLIALAEILDDNTLYKAKLSLFTDSNYPLKYHPAIKQHFSFSREREKKYKGKTLGQIACDALKKATAQDFGTDKEEWKAWVKKHF